MATPLSKQEVYQLPLQSNIQPQTGDIFFCCGPYLSSKFVQFLTKSCWSHCGLVWNTDEGIFLLDAVANIGVRIVPLAQYTRPVQGWLYDGPVVLGRWKGLDAGSAGYMLGWGLSKVSEPYDFLDHMSLWLRGLCGVFKVGYKGERGPFSKWLCAELVGACLYNSGFPHSKEGRTFTTPALLWEHEDLEMVARIA